MADEGFQRKSLVLESVIGFAGNVPDGLVLHPDDEHIIYPLGSTIVVKNLLQNSQRFLQKNGHDRSVSCLVLSPSGRYLASGQETHMGFPAVVIIWELESGEVVHRLKLHKGKIQDLAFSHCESFLATLGGPDDNKLVMWDLESGEPICGSPAANDNAHCVHFFNNDAFKLVTAGKYNLRVWDFDRANRKIRPTDCRLGQLKRVINCVSIDANDEFMYCGTGSGDLLQIALEAKLFRQLGPRKKPFSLGIRSVVQTHQGDLVIGSGDGTVAFMRKGTLRATRRLKLDGAVTSLVMNAAGDHFFVGTATSNVYLVHLDSFEYELRNSSHFGRINDLCFPHGFSELFVTCSRNDIRVWHTRNRTELLRIQVPNLECHCVNLTKDGKSIISGWSDGKVRAFKPKSGKLLYAINDAHEGAVLCVESSNDGRQLISGGQDGRIRLWDIGIDTQVMRASLKEHKAPIKAIALRADDTEFLSAACDGSIIVWDLHQAKRINAVFATTQFQSIGYHPDESQFLSTGTDRKITYWDAVEGSEIRILDGSTSDDVLTLAISADGEQFVSAGADKHVSVWNYDEGLRTHFGQGHSGAVTAVKISPDQEMIVSVGNEGGIFLWQLPNFEPSPDEE